MSCQRKLTFADAEDMRALHREGATYRQIAAAYPLSLRSVYSIVQRWTYRLPDELPGRYGDGDPTPHDELTYEGWHRNMQPMPSTEPHEAAQRVYAAQNERDGYLTDPEYLAAVRAWRDAPAIAAD